MAAVDWTIPYSNLGLLLLNDGRQACGDCPFCGKENHFYIDPSNGQWDCKVCLESGNLISFMTKFVDLGMMVTANHHYEELEKKKGLPRQVLKRYSVCHHPLNPNLWLLPARATTGSVVNLYTYCSTDMPDVILSTKGVGHSLIGMEFYEQKNVHGRHVYLCEGQWDLYAMADMLDAFQEGESDVLGVPGAGTFPSAWRNLFAGRHVHLCYDNDDSGLIGMAKVTQTLSLADQKPLSVTQIVWPEGTPKGFDIRDLYRDPTHFSPKPAYKPRRPPR